MDQMKKITPVVSIINILNIFMQLLLRFAANIFYFEFRKFHPIFMNNIYFSWIHRNEAKTLEFVDNELFVVDFNV